MSTDTSVHDTIAQLEARLDMDDQLSKTATIRLLKLVTGVVEQWTQSHIIDEIGALTDAELLARFAVSGTVTGSLDTREQRKINRRVAARIEFIERLKEFGGLYKAKSVGELLGVSRQTVNNHIGAGKLIAIREGNDYLIPGFQFHDDKKLPCLEEILALLKEASPEAKCSFFLNPIKIDREREALPSELLEQRPDQDTIDIIKHEARLFLSHVAG